MREGTAVGLLERAGHLAAVEASLASARAGAGSLVLLSGGPGTGKSALIERACSIAATEGMAVLAARGNELEEDFSFGVARQLLGPALDEARRRDTLHGAAAQAAALLRGEAPDDGGRDRSAAIVNGLYWLTSDVADERPALVAIDDAHWCDAPSLRYALYLARRLTDLPVAVVIATREPPARGAELIEELDAEAGVRPTRLEPLSAAASAELVRARVDGADEGFVAACFEATAGNPFLLSELLSEVIARGLEPTRTAVDALRERAPDAVVLAVARRVRSLDACTLAVLESVAVLGDDAPLALAAELAGADMDAAARAVDALAEAELLRPELPPRFAHPLVASAVRARIPRARRATLHGRAATMLAQHGAPVERLAAHLVESPSTGDVAVVDRLRAASREALGHGAPRSAARYLRRAVEEPPPAEQRADVLRELAHAEELAGDAQAAEGRLADALELTPDRRGRAATLRALGGLLYRQGRLTEAVETLERGVTTLGSPKEDLAVQMQAEVAQILSIRPDLPPASIPPPELPADDRSALSLAERSWLTMTAAAKLVAAEPVDEVLALAERAWGDGALLEQETADGTAIYALTGVLGTSGAIARDVEVTTAAIADARRRGSVLGFATASFCRGSAHFLGGRLVDAIADLEVALDARRHGWRQYLPVASALLAIARAETGDLAGARDALTLGDEDDWPADIQRGMWLWGRGHVRFAAGEAEAAYEDFRSWGEHMTGILNPAFHAAWRSHLALAAHRLGRGEEAHELAREEVEIARRFGAPHPLGAALRAYGLVERDPDARLALLGESVAVLEPSEAELERVRSLVELGAALRAARRTEEARDPLSRALDRAHALGAVRLADRAEEELRAIGMRPRRRAFSGRDALTPGERRVSEMAASGMTNREIAEALFVTPKAVKWHLGNAYRKLGISSREELAEAIGVAE